MKFEDICKELGEQYRSHACDGEQVDFFVCDTETFKEYITGLKEMFPTPIPDTDNISYAKIWFPAGPVGFYPIKREERLITAICFGAKGNPLKSK
jgi:hypothetical protein